MKTSVRYFKSDGVKDPYNRDIDRCVNCRCDIMEHYNGKCPEDEDEEDRKAAEADGRA